MESLIIPYLSERGNSTTFEYWTGCKQVPGEEYEIFQKLLFIAS